MLWFFDTKINKFATIDIKFRFFRNFYIDLYQTRDNCQKLYRAFRSLQTNIEFIIKLSNWLT